MLANGLAIKIRVAPRSGQDHLGDVAMLADGACVLQARVRALAAEGAANAALCHLVAERLGVAPSRVKIAAGARGRVKTVIVEGDGHALAAKLDTLIRGAAA